MQWRHGLKSFQNFHRSGKQDRVLSWWFAMCRVHTCWSLQEDIVLSLTAQDTGKQPLVEISSCISEGTRCHGLGVVVDQF